MSIITRSKTRLVQPIPSLVNSSRIQQRPRKGLRSRQGDTGSPIMVGIGITLLIGVRVIPETFTRTRCVDMTCKTFSKLKILHYTKISVINRTYKLINREHMVNTGEYINCHEQYSLLNAIFRENSIPT